MYKKKELSLNEKFINLIMKDGKKILATRILTDALDYIKEKGNKEPQKVLEKAFENVMPMIEVKAKRVGGSVYQVPVEVKPKRQLGLAMRRILIAARKKSGAAMFERLAKEILLAYNSEGEAIKKKEDVHRMAEANKAFAHFARF